MPDTDDTRTLLAAALDAGRGLADVDVTDLPTEAQAAWARMTRPVLVALLDAIDGAR